MDTAEQLAIQKIISAVETYQASDVHLSVGNPPMMRVRGRLVAVPDQPLLTPSFMEHIIFSWLDERNTERLQVNKDLTFAKTFENKKRFKISVFYQQSHLSASLTLIPDVIPPLQNLGLPTPAQQLVLTESGLVFIIGPFGSQRSTTMRSFIEYLNQNAQKHILTVEQPVEYVFRDQQCVIDQREVGQDVYTVDKALQFALDEDVDVVMVSDLSTAEGFRAAIEVASAGKTVFAVMHAKSILAALNYVIDRFDGADQDQVRSELANCLAGIINQRSVTTTAGDKAIIAEVMVPNTAIRTVIQQGELVQIQNILLTSREEGMRSLDMALRMAMEMGQISRQEAYRHALNPGTFQ